MLAIESGTGHFMLLPPIAGYRGMRRVIYRINSEELGPLTEDKKDGLVFKESFEFSSKPIQF
jgi:hypothetical protein